MGVNTMGTNVNELIVSYQPMLSAVVNKLIDSGRVRLTSVYDEEELMSIGYQVLWNMLCETNDRRTISSRKIIDKIIAEIESENPNALCLPSNEFETTRLGEAYGIHDTVDYSESVDIIYDDIRDVLSTLKPREERILLLRFGFIDGSAWTLEQIGSEFGVNRERIRQIEAKALRKLRHPLRSKRLRDYLDDTQYECIYNGNPDTRMDESSNRYDILKNNTGTTKTVIHKTIRKVTTIIEEVEECIEVTTEDNRHHTEDVADASIVTTYGGYCELDRSHPVAYDILESLDGIYRNKYNMRLKILSRARDVNKYYHDPSVYKRFKVTLDKCIDCVENVIIPNITKDIDDMADYMRCDREKFESFIYDLQHLNIGSLVLYDVFGELSDTHPDVKKFKQRIYHYAKRCNMPYITRHFVNDGIWLFGHDVYEVVLDMNSLESMKTKSIATQHLSK